jgi:6-phosphogluconolactonase
MERQSRCDIIQSSTQKREETPMIDRRMLTTLLASAAVAPVLAPRPSSAQATKSKAVFYASVGSELTLYGMNIEDATLDKRGAVKLPANVQYAWPHPSKQYFYVVSSSGGPGVAGDNHFVNAFQIDQATGALTPHGQPQNLPWRPIHTSVDIAGEYLLTAYNDPSSLTVHRINRDGTLGAKVDQQNRLDTGKYAHQIRATPDNQQVIPG